MRKARNFVFRPRRDWPSNWLTNRDCVCNPYEEHVLDWDQSCYRCGGRVVQRSPFHPDGWSRG